MNCDINLFSCLQKEKQDIIKLAIKCKVVCNEKDEIEVFNLDITQLGTKIYNFKNNNNNIYNTKYLELLKKKRINITLRYSIFPSKENSIELENINKKIKEIENKLKKVTKKNSGNLLGIRK